MPLLYQCTRFDIEQKHILGIFQNMSFPSGDISTFITQLIRDFELLSLSKTSIFNLCPQLYSIKL